MLAEAGCRDLLRRREMAHDHPDLVRAEAAQGEVGDHTWSHPLLTNLTDTQIAWQINRTAEELAAAGGGGQPTLFRPPYGAENSRVRSDIGALGRPLIQWSWTPWIGCTATPIRCTTAPSTPCDPARSS